LKNWKILLITYLLFSHNVGKYLFYVCKDCRSRGFVCLAFSQQQKYTYLQPTGKFLGRYLREILTQGEDPELSASHCLQVKQVNLQGGRNFF
jgi:hypothetical protein